MAAGGGEGDGEVVEAVVEDAEGDGGEVVGDGGEGEEVGGWEVVED